MLIHGHMIAFDDCLPVTLFLSVLLRDIQRHVRKRGTRDERHQNSDSICEGAPAIATCRTGICQTSGCRAEECAQDRRPSRRNHQKSQQMEQLQELDIKNSRNVGGKKVGYSGHGVCGATGGSGQSGASQPSNNTLRTLRPRIRCVQQCDMTPYGSECARSS